MTRVHPSTSILYGRVTHLVRVVYIFSSVGSFGTVHTRTELQLWVTARCNLGKYADVEAMHLELLPVCHRVLGMEHSFKMKIAGNLASLASLSNKKKENAVATTSEHLRD